MRRCDGAFLKMKTLMTRSLPWDEQKALYDRAQRLAEEILNNLGISSPPIDPFEVAAAEHPLPKIGRDNFGTLFDGQLEYHRSKNRFILFHNTKYDDNYPGRGRFSAAHELGHYHIPEHRQLLLLGAKPHGSRGEFSTEKVVEREADSFASALLLPRRLVYPLVAGAEFTRDSLTELAATFQTSLVCTTIRATQLTPFPCASILVLDGTVVWRQFSDSMIEAGCYPSSRMSVSASEQWIRVSQGQDILQEREARLIEWCQVYNNEGAEQAVVSELYFSIPIMNALLIVVLVSEDDIFTE